MRRITRLMGLVAPIMLTATLAMPGIASTTTMEPIYPHAWPVAATTPPHPATPSTTGT